MRQGTSISEDRQREARSSVAPACDFVIFGITGDLASRKLLPALYALDRAGRLDPGTRIVGYGRSEVGTDELREQLRSAVAAHGREFDESSWRELAGRITYCQGAYDDPDSMRRLAEELRPGPPNRVFYTATPPATYGGIVETLARVGLARSDTGWTRLVIEKPFGHDLASARALNDLVLARFDEDQVYRIDHYLGKETAQNLAALRFANTLFEPVWNNRYLDHVQITMAETVGVEERGGFYEQAGVIRDVFQNHLLQLLALVAMEPPARYDAKSVRNEKVKVLEAVGCRAPEAAVFGQYAAGAGHRAYREEDSVASDSLQATYAAVEFEISNWRWAGVPFYVRSGKRLEMKATEIVLHFKSPPHIPFALAEPLRTDRLILRIAPDEGISLRFNIKRPGQQIAIDRTNLNFSYADYFERENPDAYETLLLDVMTGDATLFMRADEVEAQWRVVAPLLDLPGRAGQAPALYPAGSMGPVEAFRLLEERGRYWHRPGEGR